MTKTTEPAPASEDVEPLRFEGKRAIEKMRADKLLAEKNLRTERRLRIEAERKSKLYDQIIADIAAAQNQENQS